MQSGLHSFRWEVEHQNCQRPGENKENQQNGAGEPTAVGQFEDRALKSPFAHWLHCHRFEPLELFSNENDSGGKSKSGRGCRMIDEIEWELPWYGRMLGIGPWLLKKELQRAFGYRHRVLVNDLAFHFGAEAPTRKLRVLIGGASGLVGTQLAAFFLTGGHEVKRLVRSGNSKEADTISWNPANNPANNPGQ